MNVRLWFAFHYRPSPQCGSCPRSCNAVCLMVVARADFPFCLFLIPQFFFLVPLELTYLAAFVGVALGKWHGGITCS